MERAELEKYITESFGADAEHPWESKPEYAVFRHGGNAKWFAVAMTVPKRVLGLKDEGNIDIVNLKCDYVLISSLASQKGIFPAYHMNKVHWISVALDGSVDAATVKWLLDVSYDLTAPKIKKTR